MSDPNDPSQPPPSSPFPDSSLTPPPEEAPPPPPPVPPAPPSVPDPLAPAPPIPPAPPEPRPWMETPPEPAAPAFPPGYTSPPPPGAGFPAPPATSPIGAPAPGTHVLAGWWRRVGAAIIDGILIVAIGAILAFLVGASMFSADETGVTGFILGMLTFVLFVGLGALVYIPVMMGRTNGKTIGRMVTGIRVIRADGQPITVGFAAIREVAVKWLLVGGIAAVTIGLVWLVDVLWPLWDDENRALHDFVVNTRTVMD